jgi:hypothetical protein
MNKADGFDPLSEISLSIMSGDVVFPTGMMLKLFHNPEKSNCQLHSSRENQLHGSIEAISPLSIW